MDHKVQLKHPRGKKPVSISKEKYDLLKPLVLKYVRAKGEASFSEISNALARDFRTSKTKFQGSLPWYLEWVTLDLEARKIIQRVDGTSPRYCMIVK